MSCPDEHFKSSGVAGLTCPQDSPPPPPPPQVKEVAPRPLTHNCWFRKKLCAHLQKLALLVRKNGHFYCFLEKSWKRWKCEKSGKNVHLERKRGYYWGWKKTNRTKNKSTRVLKFTCLRTRPLSAGLKMPRGGWVLIHTIKHGEGRLCGDPQVSLFPGTPFLLEQST